MTADRLAEIKERLHAYKHWKEKAGDSIDDTHAPDIDWLISEIERMQKRAERLKEALQFYADSEEYPPKEISEQYNTPNLKCVVFDFGGTAREALKDG